MQFLKCMGILGIFLLFYCSETMAEEMLLQKVQLDSSQEAHIILKDESVTFFNTQRAMGKTLPVVPQFHPRLSKNQQNLTMLEIPDDYRDIEPKARKEAILLFDVQGNVLARSAPMDLYDWTVCPVGDNKTILVIFPAGTAPKASIAIFREENQNLSLVKEIQMVTGNFSWDIAFDGAHFITGVSAWGEKHNQSKIILFDRSGNEIWNNRIEEKSVTGVHISRRYNFVVAFTRNPEKSQRYAYIFQFSGQLVKKFLIGKIGDYSPEFSNDDKELYVAINSGYNEVYLLNTQTGTMIFEYKDTNPKLWFNSLHVTTQGELYLTGIVKERNQRFEEYMITAKYLLIFDESGIAQTKEIDYDGVPYIRALNGNAYLEMALPQKSSYYEIRR